MKLTPEQIARKIALYDTLKKALGECDKFINEVVAQADDAFADLHPRGNDDPAVRQMRDFLDEWMHFDVGLDIAESFDMLPTTSEPRP